MSERELCDRFRAVAARGGLVVYPECSGWDMVAVRLDEADSQLGIEAKLKPNLEVLAQACRNRNTRGPNPRYRAVLVPLTPPEPFRVLARELGIAVISMEALGADFMRSRGDVEVENLRAICAQMKPHATTRPLWVPPYVPDLPAGVPSPRTVGPWRVNAARLCARLRAGETLTRADFTAHGINIARWLEKSRYGAWLERVPGTKPARYMSRNPDRLPDMDFPDVAAGLGLPVPRKK